MLSNRNKALIVKTGGFSWDKWGLKIEKFVCVANNYEVLQSAHYFSQQTLAVAGYEILSHFKKGGLLK